MSKYEPLQGFLAARREAEVPMTFHEIEEVIGDRLPPVAFKHRAWWSNNPSNSVITRAWLEAGFKTARVDMGSQRLVFRRAEGGARADQSPQPAARMSSRKGGVLARLQAALAGTVHFAPDFDATAPTGETWDADR